MGGLWYVEVRSLGLPKEDFEVGGRVVAWRGGWVGGWVVRKVEEIKAVRMSYCNGWVGGWVGGMH